MKRAQGFTLIELLIVVAILGILAIIAVPNFNAAMVRARVARSQADMVNLAKTIELFRADMGVLLVDPWNFDTGLGQRRVLERFHGVGFSLLHRSPLDVLAPLSSPIPYFSTLPEDHIEKAAIRYRDPEASSVVEARLANNPDGYHYFNLIVWDPEIPNHPAFNRDGSLRNPWFVSSLKPGDYCIIGRGPGNSSGPMSIALTPYNVSNGLFSEGSIQYYSNTGMEQH